MLDHAHLSICGTVHEVTYQEKPERGEGPRANLKVIVKHYNDPTQNMLVHVVAFGGRAKACKTLTAGGLVTANGPAHFYDTKDAGRQLSLVATHIGVPQ